MFGFIMQRYNMKFHLIYYASRMLNPNQGNYTTMGKELLAIVYAFHKFQSYLVLSKLQSTQIMQYLDTYFQKMMPNHILLGGFFFDKNLTQKFQITRAKKIWWQTTYPALNVLKEREMIAEKMRMHSLRASLPGLRNICSGI